MTTKYLSRSSAIVLALVIASGLASGAAAQQARSTGARPVQLPEVDTEHIFGFTEGSDIGEKGELEGEHELDGGLGKRSGRYAAIGQTLQLKYSVLDNFRIAPTIMFSYQDISGVPGLDDRRQYNFQGTGVELRFRLLNREHAPFGLTLSATPTWNGRDEGTGRPVQQFAMPFIALFDKELVKDQTYAAFNVSYEPRWTRERPSGVSENDSVLGFAAAISHRVMPNLFLGGEVRYLRAYSGAGLNEFSGDALFAGPTLYWILSERANLTLAWNTQIVGKAVDEPGSLDLSNFERHQFRVRFGYSF